MTTREGKTRDGKLHKAKRRTTIDNFDVHHVNNKLFFGVVVVFGFVVNLDIILVISVLIYTKTFSGLTSERFNLVLMTLFNKTTILYCHCRLVLFRTTSSTVKPTTPPKTGWRTLSTANDDKTNTTNSGSNNASSVSTLVSVPEDGSSIQNLQSSNNDRKKLDLDHVHQAIEEITGVHEIAALKEQVTRASDQLQAATQRLQDLRQTLDDQIAAHHQVSTVYQEMLARRHEWTDADVQQFARLTADEGRARTAADTTREELAAAEDAWQAAQTRYMDAVRQRYHEEQIWHDKWRVLGTYWTWALIALNSIVFIGGQVMHYRRETYRLQSLHEMIRPLTEAAQLELRQNELHMLKEEAEAVAELEDDGTTRRRTSTERDANSVVDSLKDAKNKETASSEKSKSHDNEDSLSVVERNHRLWQKHFQQWTQSTAKLCRQTGKLLHAQWASVAGTCAETSRQVLWEPSVHVATEMSHLATAHDFHWPSALAGATIATLVVLVVTMVRTRQ